MANNTVTRTLAGKVALVTGGSRGFGAAIVKRLAQDAAVAFTYASARPKADEAVRAIESAGGKALAIHADSADADAVKSAGLVAYVASPEAAFVTGAWLPIDGGFGA